MLHLYDTATREVRELAQRDPGKVSIYLCGPTVYAPPHLGHGRQNVVYDVLVRYLRWSGVDVRLVSNITDIDDQIINRANAEGRPWQDITTKSATSSAPARSGIRPTSCCGSWPSPASRRGRRPGAKVDPAGTASASS
jgi:cysteinyl-tRNA synthetase